MAGSRYTGISARGGTDASQNLNTRITLKMVKIFTCTVTIPRQHSPLLQLPAADAETETDFKNEQYPLP
jgi:hypothetical protein